MSASNKKLLIYTEIEAAFKMGHPKYFKYKPIWETWWTWISKSPRVDPRYNNNYAYCNVCNRDYICKETLLRQHHEKYHAICGADDLNKENVEPIKKIKVTHDNQNGNSNESIFSDICDEIPSNHSTEKSVINVNNDNELARTNSDELLLQHNTFKDYDAVSDTFLECNNLDQITSFSISKKVYKKKRMFRPEWAEIHKWVQQIPNNCYKVRCTLCQENLTAHATVLNAHAFTNKHMIKEDSEAIFDSFDFQKAITEIKMSAFIAWKRLPFILVDDLIPFIKVIGFDSAILDNISLSRKKVMCNVTAPAHQLRLGNILKNTFFSIKFMN